MSVLGKVSPATGEDVLAYVCPVAKKASVNIAATNRSVYPIDVTFSLSSATDLGIEAIEVVKSGSELTGFPEVVIEGSGVGASAVVSALTVKKAEIKSGGMGYNVGNTLMLKGGTHTGVCSLKVLAVNGDGTVESVIVSSGGTYQKLFSEAEIECEGGTGTGFTLAADSLRYGVAKVTVKNPGNDYLDVASVKVTEGEGVELEAQMTRAAIEEKDAIEFMVTVPPKGVLERSGVTLGAGDAVFVKASRGDSVNFFVFGVEAVV